jgi:hypothetical protein
VISTIENSNKFQKTKFWKEKSVEDAITLGPTTHATLINDEFKEVFLKSWFFYVDEKKLNKVNKGCCKANKLHHDVGLRMHLMNGGSFGVMI